MNAILKIKITDNFKLLYSIISKANQEIIHQEEIIPCILFKSNSIEIGVEDEQTIHFMQKWIEEPDDYKTYSIEFIKNSYDLLPEVLFSIVVNEIRKKV